LGQFQKPFPHDFGFATAPVFCPPVQPAEKERNRPIANSVLPLKMTHI
jgi:hypothetical protein